MDPVAVGIELSLGEGFVEGDGVKLAEFTSLFPGVTLDLETFKGLGISEVAEKGVSEFVKQQETEIIVGF